jgi:hypothetical protein
VPLRDYFSPYFPRHIHESLQSSHCKVQLQEVMDIVWQVGECRRSSAVGPQKDNGLQQAGDQFDFLNFQLAPRRVRSIHIVSGGPLAVQLGGQDCEDDISAFVLLVLELLGNTPRLHWSIFDNLICPFQADLNFSWVEISPCNVEDWECTEEHVLDMPID